MSKSSELTKKTLIISIGRISTQFVSFFLIPFYTAFLSTTEYGTVDLILNIVQLVVPMMSVMIDQGVFRALIGCNNENEKSKIISTGFFLLLLISGGVTVIYFFVSLFFVFSYRVIVLMILVSTSFSNFFLQVSRGVGQTGYYTLSSFLCSAVTIFLNVFCIACLKMGAVGMLWAMLVGNIICCLFIFCRLSLFKYISHCLCDKMIGKDMLRYSMPLVPNQLSIWIMNSSDRIIVSGVLGVDANGVLAVSHKFPLICMSVYNVFQLAWHEVGALAYYEEDRNVFFSQMWKKVVVFFSSLCILITIVLPFVFDMFVGRGYHEAYYNIPIYFVAVILNVAVGFWGVIYVATKNTKQIARTTMIAAVLNVIINLLLINKIGLYAASISSLLSYFIALIYRIRDARKYININFLFGEIWICIILAGGAIYLYYLCEKKLLLWVLPLYIIMLSYINRELFLKMIVRISNKIKIN